MIVDVRLPEDDLLISYLENHPVINEGRVGYGLHVFFLWVKTVAQKTCFAPLCAVPAVCFRKYTYGRANKDGLILAVGGVRCKGMNMASVLIAICCARYCLG